MLTKLADKIGLLELLAPRRKKEEEEEDADGGGDGSTPSNGRRGGGDGGDGELEGGAQRQATTERTRRLGAQLEAERAAESCGVYAKKQRVRYHHRATDSRHDAVIVGVHFDDGPDKPYYTIRYSKPIVQTNEDDGAESVVIGSVEKQTTPDRLERMPWDEDAVWELLREGC